MSLAERRHFADDTSKISSEALLSDGIPSNAQQDLLQRPQIRTKEVLLRAANAFNYYDRMSFPCR